MQRVLVMGSSGSGKSTFARRLSEIAGIPLVSLDALQALICFTDRTQANEYLKTIALEHELASVH